ncbi:hypothetical protein FOCC_FOCC006094 [Frankliniella occidentalis]|nr:hypothetical protein FOCC_FOCC006094 [Frankliniella occidentalis]
MGPKCCASEPRPSVVGNECGAPAGEAEPTADRAEWCCVVCEVRLSEVRDGRPASYDARCRQPGRHDVSALRHAGRGPGPRAPGHPGPGNQKARHRRNPTTNHEHHGPVPGRGTSKKTHAKLSSDEASTFQRPV